MKRLNEIIAAVDVLGFQGQQDLEISGLNFDSRKCVGGNMFIAIKGEQADGHAYIEQAIANGAVAVLCEVLPDTLQKDISYILVKDANEATAIVADAFYDSPSKELTLVGVTGTNGKTTTTTLLYELFTSFGEKVGLLSTVKILVGKEEFAASHTTPDSITINAFLRKMVDEGCTYCFMEVSSHGISQKRTYGLDFDGGIFTNLSHDHLDYHKTFSAYRDVKKVFFDELKKEAFALINVDDKNGAFMLQNTKGIKKSYGLKGIADYKGKVLESQFSGMLMTVDTVEVWVQLIGAFNASNLLAVYGAAVSLGKTKEEVIVGLSVLRSVSGRFQYFVSKDNVTAIVDYAHTPDALENVLGTINSIRTMNEQLITVVGCGGNRDKTKRPEMARIASAMSSRVIFTSDNPRFEEPSAILQDMEVGVEAEHSMKTIIIEDRKQAIKLACQEAKKGDIILIAGKGHEDYQEIKGVRNHFNDLEIVTEFLENK